MGSAASLGQEQPELCIPKTPGPCRPRSLPVDAGHQRRAIFPAVTPTSGCVSPWNTWVPLLPAPRAPTSCSQKELGDLPTVNLSPCSDPCGGSAEPTGESPRLRPSGTSLSPASRLTFGFTPKPETEVLPPPFPPYLFCSLHLQLLPHPFGLESRCQSVGSRDVAACPPRSLPRPPLVTQTVSVPPAPHPGSYGGCKLFWPVAGDAHSPRPGLYILPGALQAPSASLLSCPDAGDPQNL